MNKILGFVQRQPQPKPTKIYITRIYWSEYFPNRKTIVYSVETNHGVFELSVEVPYHPDDREADRLGRIEVRRLLNSAVEVA
jgi:hypothetical protein